MINAVRLDLQMQADIDGLAKTKDMSRDSGYNFYKNISKKIIDQFVEAYGGESSGPSDLKQFELTSRFTNDALASLPKKVLGL